MGTLYYNVVWHACAPAFTVSASPVVLHRDRVPRRGAFILAANHLSPYDIPCLMKETPRMLDFLSIREVFRNPLVGWFYGNMGAFPLDRGRVDTGATRTVLDRLRRGRVVAIFPEGQIRADADSVLHGGRMKPGVLRLARLADVPILPVVVLGTRAYHRFTSWLPLRRTIYGINYGDPIALPPGNPRSTELEDRLRAAFGELYAELSAAMAARSPK